MTIKTHTIKISSLSRGERDALAALAMDHGGREVPGAARDALVARGLAREVEDGAYELTLAGRILRQEGEVAVPADN